MAYKVFTNGSVLNASEVNDNLMKQAVAVFSNAAARTAAITSPVEGQLTYLEDTNLYQHWNGSSWVSPFGSTLVASVPFTAQTGVSINNCFTSEFQNYQIVFDISVATGNTDIKYRMRAGGTDNSSALYFTTGIATVQTSGTVFVDNTNAGTSGFLATLANSVTLASRMTIFNPNLARPTHITNQAVSQFGDFINRTNGNLHLVNTAYDGITIFATSGNITGTVRVYGMRNS